jgi:hypothetical protein
MAIAMADSLQNPGSPTHAAIVLPARRRACPLRRLPRCSRAAAMTESKSLQMTRQAAAPRSPEHKRFNTLIGQIERARRQLAEWHTQGLVFRQAYAQRIAPLQDKLLAGLSEWVFALDQVLPQRCWTRSERKTLRQLLCTDVEQLLKIKPTDALRELYDKHSDVDFDTSQREELEVLKEMTEMFTGVDLGDTSGIHTEDDLLEHVGEKMAAHHEALRERSAEHAQRRRKSPAQQRREAEAQRVTQSVREIFRKLASALHPDREPDPQERTKKNELMQKVNRAYEANDLLTLLEVQLQIEQVSPEQIQNVDSQRVKHYNKVLAEQLSSLKHELKDLQLRLEMELNVELYGNDPKQLGPALEHSVRSLRGELARQQRDLRMLSDIDATKRWLKREREAMQRADAPDDFF